MLKGSQKAKEAALNATETRARNRALNGIKLKTNKCRGIVTSKIQFKRLDDSNFHMLAIDSPCKIFIEKSFKYVYISPNRTEITRS